MEQISGLSLYILQALEKNHIFNKYQLMNLTHMDSIDFVKELTSLGYVEYNEKKSVVYTIKIMPKGRAFLKSYREMEVDRKKRDRRSVTSTVLGIIGAASGLTALIWNIANSMAQSTIK